MKDGKRNILLWCDVRTRHPEVDASTVRGLKRKSFDDPFPMLSKRKQIEYEVNDLVSKKHGTKYTIPQLRLWAKIINCWNHDSTDDPPSLPAITGIQPKKLKTQPLSDAFVVAASSFASAICSSEIKQSGGLNAVVISGDSAHTPGKPSYADAHRPVGLSPGRITELRIKHKLYA